MGVGSACWRAKLGQEGREDSYLRLGQQLQVGLCPDPSFRFSRTIAPLDL
jgi:hypothetical protein